MATPSVSAMCGSGHYDRDHGKHRRETYTAWAFRYGLFVNGDNVASELTSDIDQVKRRLHLRACTDAERRLNDEF